MNLLVGSRALAYWDKSFQVKEDTDWDVISPEPLAGCEWHNPGILNNAKMLEYAEIDQVIGPNNTVLRVMDPYGLAIMKRSHLWRSLSFEKHITHYHKRLASYLEYFSAYDFEVLDERTRLTHEQYPQKCPKLNVSVNEFFDDYVTKKFNHDWLHEVVAYHQQPLYKLLQNDVESAWCNLDLWKKLSYRDKVLCVTEEVTVIAVERFLVPTDWQTPSKLAFMKSLEKVCTTLCSGWFRDFAIDNYPQIVQEFSQERFLRIKQTIDNALKGNYAKLNA
jgi:hypothetical protein